MKRLGWMLAAGAMLAGCGQRVVSDHSDEPAANGTAAAEAGAQGGAGSQAPLVRAAADPQLSWGPCPEGMPAGCGIAVLQGDPARPNADIFLRVPGGAEIPPHAHSSAERMILVGGQLEVKYQGAPPELLREGSYAYGPARRPHRAGCRSSDPCILFIAFEGPVDVLPFEGSLN